MWSVIDNLTFNYTLLYLATNFELSHEQLENNKLRFLLSMLKHTKQIIEYVNNDISIVITITHNVQTPATPSLDYSRWGGSDHQSRLLL
jgi:hypothetical protein